MSSHPVLPKLHACSLYWLAFCQGELLVQEEKWLELEGSIPLSTHIHHQPAETTNDGAEGREC